MEPATTIISRSSKNICSKAFQDFSPEILFYVAGADPFREDQLGGLKLTMEGLARRDALVFDYARRHGVPVVITLAGGYARQRGGYGAHPRGNDCGRARRGDETRIIGFQDNLIRREK